MTEVVRRLNDHFGLRDCPSHQEMIFADQKELFPAARSPGCLRYEIGTCLGPCFAACTRTGYRKGVHAACAFLHGTNDDPIVATRAAMMAASAALEFERAALLRERLELFEWVAQRLRTTRTAREGQSFIYRTTGAAGDSVWFAVHQGRVVRILRAPRTATEQKKTLRAFRAIYGPAQIGRTDVAAQEIDHLLMIEAWFRRHPEEQTRCTAPTTVMDELAELVGNAGAAALR
jgi:excinuclease ABC subunit C